MTLFNAQESINIKLTNFEILFLSFGILLSIATLLSGCTFCLRYLTSFISTSESNGLLHQAKKANLNRKKTSDGDNGEKDTVQNCKMDIPMTIITLEDDSETVLNTGSILTSEDLRRFTLVAQAGDWRYYSDCQSCSSLSDATLSPGGSPFVSPPGTPTGSLKNLPRLNSLGNNALFHPTFGMISEGRTLAPFDARRYSAQVLGEGSKYGGAKKRKSLGTLKRSLSVPDMPVCHFNPEIEFMIRYDYKRYSLIIERFKVTDLNMTKYKHTCGDLYLKADLLPTDKTRYTEKQIACANIIFNRILIYEDLNESDIHKSSLLLSVFHSDPISPGKVSIMGEALIKISELEVHGENQIVKKPLQKKRRRKKSTSSSSLFQELGDLFILLQYNSSANRLKVLVRKATHLPSGGKFPGQPDHFVLIELMKKEEKIITKETKSVRGCNPTWNEPFLFDIEGEIGEYSLEFTVFRGRMFTKDNVLGHVLIGSNGTKAGRSHWQETGSPHGLEVAKWHTILPVFKY